MSVSMRVIGALLVVVIAISLVGVSMLTAVMFALAVSGVGDFSGWIAWAITAVCAVAGVSLAKDFWDTASLLYRGR